MKKIIILALTFITTSCSFYNSQSPSKYAQKNQKLLTLTINLQSSVNLLRCTQKQNWHEAEERANKLIWSVGEHDSRFYKAKSFLSNLKKAENSYSLQSCESLLKATKYNIRTFEESLRKKKGVNTTHF